MSNHSATQLVKENNTYFDFLPQQNCMLSKLLVFPLLLFHFLMVPRLPQFFQFAGSSFKTLPRWMPLLLLHTALSE